MHKKCCECSLEASVCLVNIGEDGCMSEVNLCETHAKKHGIFTTNAYFIADGLNSKNLKKILSNNCCPHCGIAQEWVEQHKHFGCPYCKDFFKSICKDWISGFKNITTHFGKIPVNTTSKDVYKPRLEYLQKQMQTYTASENFERARICKRQIQTIERKKKSWGQ